MHQIKQKTEFFLLVAPPRGIEKKNSPSPFAPEQELNCDQGIKGMGTSQLRNGGGIVHRNQIATGIDRERVPPISLDRCVTDFAGKILQVGICVARTGFQPSELGGSAAIGINQLSDKDALAMDLLGSNHHPGGAVHRNEFTEDLLNGASQSQLNPYSRKDAGHQGLFGP